MKKNIVKEKILQPPVNSTFLKEVVQRVVNAVKPEKIILFGSYAQGKANKNSDLDLLVVKKTSLPYSKRFALVSDALYPRLIPMDFIVKTPKEIKSRLKIFDPFIKEIINNGKVLYDKK